MSVFCFVGDESGKDVVGACAGRQGGCCFRVPVQI